MVFKSISIFQRSLSWEPSHLGREHDKVMCIPFWYRKKAREYNRWNNENENVSFNVNKYDSDNSSSKNFQHKFYWILFNNKINHFFHLSSFSKLHNFIFLNFLFFSWKNWSFREIIFFFLYNNSVKTEWKGKPKMQHLQNKNKMNGK